MGRRTVRAAMAPEQMLVFAGASDLWGRRSVATLLKAKTAGAQGSQGERAQRRGDLPPEGSPEKGGPQKLDLKGWRQKRSPPKIRNEAFDK